jgi:hypothetical protein
MNSTQWETMKKVKATLQEKLDELRRAKKEGRLASATEFQRTQAHQPPPQNQTQPHPQPVTRPVSSATGAAANRPSPRFDAH